MDPQPPEHPDSSSGNNNSNTNPNSLEYMESFRNAEGKYQCVSCDKSYLHFKHLKRHYMKHTGNRPHVCRICQDTFCRSDILKRHYTRCLAKFQITGKCPAVSRVPKRAVPQPPFYGGGGPSPPMIAPPPLEQGLAQAPPIPLQQPPPQLYYVQAPAFYPPPPPIPPLHPAAALPPSHILQMQEEQMQHQRPRHNPHHPQLQLPPPPPPQSPPSLPPMAVGPPVTFHSGSGSGGHHKAHSSLDGPSPLVSPVSSNPALGYSPSYLHQGLPHSPSSSSSVSSACSTDSMRNYTTAVAMGPNQYHYHGHPVQNHTGGHGLAIYHPDGLQNPVGPPPQPARSGGGANMVRYTNIYSNGADGSA